MTNTIKQNDLQHAGIKGMKWKNSKGLGNAGNVTADKALKVGDWYQSKMAKLGKNPDPREQALLDAEYSIRSAQSPADRQEAKKAYRKLLASKGKPPIKDETQPIAEIKKSPAIVEAVQVVDDILGRKYGKVSFMNYSTRGA